MANEEQTRSEYLRALLNQRNTFNAYGNNLVNPSVSNNVSELAAYDTMFSNGVPKLNAPTQKDINNIQQTEDKKENSILGSIFGFVDEIAAKFGAGFVGAWEGILDLGATALGAMGWDAAAEWAKQDIGTNLAEWTKTYANFTPWGIVQSAKNFGNSEYWNDMLEGAKDIGGSALFASNKINNYREDADKYYGYNDEALQNMGKAGEFVGGAAYSIGFMLPSIMTGGASAAAGASSTAAKAASLASMGLSASGKGSEEALNDGATSAQALGYGVAKGAVEVASEIVVGKALEGVAKATGLSKYLGTFGKVNGVSFSKELIKKASAKELVTTMFEEGAEEVFSDLFSPICEAIYKGSDAFKQYGDKEYYKQMAMSFASGAFVGGLTSGVQTASQYKKFGKNGVAYLQNNAEFQEAYEAFKNNQSEENAAKVKQILESMHNQLIDMANNPAEQEHLKNLVDLFVENSASNSLSERVDVLKQELSQDAYTKLVNDVNTLFSKTSGADVTIVPESSLKKVDGAYPRAFLDGNHIVINETYKTQLMDLIKHEGISHALLDLDTSVRNELVNSIESNPTLKAQFHKFDNQLEQSYKGSEIESERLATFTESVLKDYKSFEKAFKGNFKVKNPIIRFFNNLANRFSKIKGIDKSYINAIDKVLKSLNAEKETNNTKKLKEQPAYAKDLNVERDSDGNVVNQNMRKFMQNSYARVGEKLNAPLVPVYHSTNDYGFTIFDEKFNDRFRNQIQHGFYFSDNIDVSMSYLDETIIYKSLNDFRKYVAETYGNSVNIGKTLSETKIKIGNVINKMVIGDTLTRSDIVVGETFLEYAGDDFWDFDSNKNRFVSNVGEIVSGEEFAQIADMVYTKPEDSTYKVYLNLTNPLIIDGKGNLWNEIDNIFNKLPFDKEYKKSIGKAVKDIVREVVNNERPLIKIKGDFFYNIKGIKEDDIKSFSVHIPAEEAIIVKSLKVLHSYPEVKRYLELKDLYRKEHSKPRSKIDKVKMAEYQKQMRDLYSKNNEMIDSYLTIRWAFKEAVAEALHNSFRKATTRQLTAIAYKKGYDGVIFKNIIDMGGSTYDFLNSNIYVAFNSNQIKNVDNKNPTANDDIRYSKPLDTKTEATKVSDDEIKSERKKLADAIKAVKNTNSNTKKGAATDFVEQLGDEYTFDTNFNVFKGNEKVAKLDFYKEKLDKGYAWTVKSFKMAGDYKRSLSARPDQQFRQNIRVKHLAENYYYDGKNKEGKDVIVRTRITKGKDGTYTIKEYNADNSIKDTFSNLTYKGAEKNLLKHTLVNHNLEELQKEIDRLNAKKPAVEEQIGTTSRDVKFESDRLKTIISKNKDFAFHTEKFALDNFVEKLGKKYSRKGNTIYLEGKPLAQLKIYQRKVVENKIEKTYYQVGNYKFVGEYAKYNVTSDPIEGVYKVGDNKVQLRVRNIGRLYQIEYTDETFTEKSFNGEHVVFDSVENVKKYLKYIGATKKGRPVDKIGNKSSLIKTEQNAFEQEMKEDEGKKVEAKQTKPVKVSSSEAIKTYKTFNETRNILDTVEGVIKTSLGKNAVLSYPRNFKFKAFSEINSVKLANNEAVKLVNLFLKSNVRIKSSNKYIDLGTLEGQLTKDDVLKLTSEVTKIIEGAQAKEAKTVDTRQFEISLERTVQKLLEQKDMSQLTRSVANQRRIIKDTIKKVGDITDDYIARNGVDFLFKPIWELKATNGGSTTYKAKDVKANFELVKSWYNEIGAKPDTYTNLRYDPEIADLIDNIIESIGEAEIQVIKYKDGSNGEREIWGGLSAETMAMLKDYAAKVKHVTNEIKKSAMEEILPSANQSFNAVNAMSYGKRKDIISKVFRMYKRGFAPAYTVVRQILGGNSAVAQVLTADTQIAINNKQLYVGLYHDAINAKLKELGIKKTLDSTKVAINGHELSADEAMYLYVSLNVEANRKAIEENGAKYYDKNGNTKTLFNGGDVTQLQNEVSQKLGEKYKKLGNWLLSTMNGGIKADYIKWYESRFGKYQGRNEIGKINENEYWTLCRAYDKPSNVEKAVINPMGVFLNSKARKGSENAVMVGGALSTVTAYIDRLSTEIYLKPQYRKAYRILSAKTSNGQTLYELLKEKVDPQDVAYLNKTMKDVVGALENKNDLFTGVMSRFSVAKLSLNAGSILKQFASIFTSNIPLRRSTKALIAKGFRNEEFKSEYNKLVDEIGGLKYREANSTVIAANADSFSGITEKIARGGMYLISKMDLFTIKTGVEALMYIGQDQFGYKIGTQENIDFVKQQWVEFELSQIGSGVLSKNAISRGDYNTLPKALFSFLQGANRAAFGSQITKVDLWLRNRNVTQESIDSALKSANSALKEFESKHTIGEKFDSSTLEDEDINEYTRLKTEQLDAQLKAEDYKKYVIAGGKAIPVNMTAGLIAQGIFIAMINELMRHIKGRKDWDEWDVAEMGQSLLLSIGVDWLPFVNTVSNFIKGYEIEVPAVSVLNEFGDILSSAKSGDIKGVIRQIALLVGDATGIPFQTIYDYIYGTVKAFDPAAAYELQNVLYGSSVQSATKSLNSYIERGNAKRTNSMLKVVLDKYRVESSEETREEITDLLMNGYRDVLPKQFMTSYVDENGETVELTKEQIENFRNLYNQAEKQIKFAISMNNYRDLTKAERAKLLKKIYDIYYGYAKGKVLGKEGDTKLSNLLVLTNGNVDIAKYVFYLQKIGSIEASKTKSKKELTIDYINKIRGFSSQDKLLLMYLNGYSVSGDSQTRLLSFLIKKGMTRKQAKAFLKIS